MKILVTGITGKVGQSFLDLFLSHKKFSGATLVALCNRRTIEERENIRVVKGSIADPEVTQNCMQDVTHVLHLAAVKESPDFVVDVAMKGMFNLLEAAKASSTLKQFILLSGDCVVGHIFKSYAEPIVENSPRRGYEGVYSLTKVVEETMLEQYQVQYGINGTTLRAPWIMEKDDFRYALSFGAAQFGGPLWSELLSTEQIEKAVTGSLVPLLRDTNGKTLKRNFIHISDLMQVILAAFDNRTASQQLFNVSMDEPIDYGELAAYLKATRSLDSIEVPTPYHSNWFSNSKAKHLLNWAPEVGLEEMVERAWAFVRAADDPRKIWYPG